ncbi:transcriptional regulator [Natronococcus pandeyae]|uniref:Transcriptional regulator n=1 Tax=Natronococcus pandeyae TaxID=2055836 RepID=A0A8J8TSH7_9EURY|nr:transcriptional regulator [Natronococcus pandeyae]TYL40628.1 transcriptional regulator [Natronococcus pandeyae]
MDSRTQERVEQWDSRAFSGGYDGLRDLVASDFSGAVTAAGSWLFLLNGRIVGTVGGAVEDFENESGTRYEAPHPSLPLLCAMEEQGGETRAKYYTNETPLREVDETLQNGSFTGYIELSENVLSGDYYVIYYGGRRMAAAYIGSAERLLTGDEAFERAADEVGIYEVIDVEIEVADVPRSDDSTPDSDATESIAGTDGRDETAETDVTSETDVTDDTAETDEQPATDSQPPEPEGTSASNPQTDSATPAASSGADSASFDGETSNTASGITTADEAETSQESPTGITEPADSETSNAPADPNASDRVNDRDETVDPSADTATVTGDTTETDTDETSADADETSTDADESTAPDTEASDGGSTRTDSSPDPEAVEAAARELDRQDIDWIDEDSEGAKQSEDAELEERFEQEEQWRETRSIPSIDPDNTAASDAATSVSGSGPSGREDAAGNRTQTESTQSAPSNPEEGRSSSQSPRQPDRTQRSDATSTGAGADDERRETADQQLATVEKQRNALRTKVEKLETERDQLRSKNRKLSSTVEQLRSRVEELETELERARAATGADRERTAGTQLSREEALSGTNLFVRYASKSQPTLDTAHDGGADRSEVEPNLRLEHHTQFDESDVVVDGDSYEDMLTSSMEYRFVDWLTSVVLYEIRDTGHADALGDLYDAIPRIDRAELHASISLEDDETEAVPDQVGFDVVAYDKMGSPLLVANLNDSREPASQAMLEEMEKAASAVKANYPDLAAATVVTSSYFEPGALEVVEQATSGGFLSRGSRLSYVNLSRKQGYHLCLAESRSEGFHMNVPEL